MLRRQFILRAAGAAGAIALRGRAEHHVISMRPRIVETDLTSAQSQYTPVEDFYVRDHYSSPSATPPPGIEIAGSVARPGRWAMTDLSQLPPHTLGAVLECAGDPAAAVSLVSNGLWHGWRLKDVVGLAKVAPSATHIHCYGQDGFARSMPLSEALDCGLIATHLNGRQLTMAHGAPWRVMFPGWYGMNSVKWLSKLALSDAPLPNIGTTYTESRLALDGNVHSRPLPKIQVKSIIAAPRSETVLRRGRTLISGLAWSGNGRVSKVEVSSVAEEGWVAAEIKPAASKFEWVTWRANLQLSQPGPVTIACRAADDAGNTQPPQRDDRRLDGYTDNAYHRVRCIVIA